MTHAPNQFLTSWEGVADKSERHMTGPFGATPDHATLRSRDLPLKNPFRRRI